MQKRDRNNRVSLDWWISVFIRNHLFCIMAFCSNFHVCANNATFHRHSPGDSTSTSWGSAGSHHCSCGGSSGGLCSHSIGGPSAVPHIHQNEDDCKSTAAPTRPHLAPLFTFLCYCSNDNSRQTLLKFVVCIHGLTDVTSRVIKTYDAYDV